MEQLQTVVLGVHPFRISYAPRESIKDTPEVACRATNGCVGGGRLKYDCSEPHDECNSILIGVRFCSIGSEFLREPIA